MDLVWVCCPSTTPIVAHQQSRLRVWFHLDYGGCSRRLQEYGWNEWSLKSWLVLQGCLLGLYSGRFGYSVLIGPSGSDGRTFRQTATVLWLQWDNHSWTVQAESMLTFHQVRHRRDSQQFHSYQPLSRLPSSLRHLWERLRPSANDICCLER